MKEKIYDTVNYDLADLTSRFIAIMIDGFILALIAGAFVGAGKGAGAGMSFIVGVAYNWYFWTRQNGQTPGKMIMNIRVVKADGSPIGDMDAILRFIVYYINSAVFMLGWLWALNPDRQGWHDKIANTYVVKAGKRKNDEI